MPPHQPVTVVFTTHIAWACAIFLLSGFDFNILYYAVDHLHSSRVRSICLLNYNSRRVRSVYFYQPSWRLRHEEEQEALQERRYGAQTNHDSPARSRVPMLGKYPSNHVRDDLAQRDGQDIHGDHQTAVGGGRQLGEVQRGHEARGADGKAYDGAAEHHLRHGDAEGLDEGAEDEEHVGDEDDGLAAEAVGEDRGRGGRGEGEERRRRRDDGLIERAQLAA